MTLLKIACLLMSLAALVLAVATHGMRRYIAGLAYAGAPVVVTSADNWLVIVFELALVVGWAIALGVSIVKARRD